MTWLSSGVATQRKIVTDVSEETYTSIFRVTELRLLRRLLRRKSVTFKRWAARSFGNFFYNAEFYVLLTVHLGLVLVSNQLDAQFFFSYMFISILYMFRAPLCSSSGESIVLIRHLVYVNYVGDRLVCRSGWNCSSSIQTCTLDGHLHRVTYTKCRINTIYSPDDEHSGARNM